MLRMGAHFRPGIYHFRGFITILIDIECKITGRSYSLWIPHSTSEIPIKLSLPLDFSPDDKICLFGFSLEGVVSKACILSMGPLEWLLSFPQLIPLALSWGCYTRCDAYLRRIRSFFHAWLFSIGWTSCRLTTSNKSILHFLRIKWPAWKEILWVASSKQLSRKTVITFRRPFLYLGFTQTTHNLRICWILVRDVFCLRLKVYCILKPLSGIPSSVGIIPRGHPYTSVNYAVKTFRHALALDERRARFRPKTWCEATLERELDLDVDEPDFTYKPLECSLADVEEVWFSGKTCSLQS